MRCSPLRHSFKSLALSAFVIALALGTWAPCHCQPAAKQPVVDFFELMDKVNELASLSLWPGFDPRTVPTAIFDSVNTYLVMHPAPPQGFEAVEGKPGVYRFAGQHPGVVRNGYGQIADVRTATMILRAQSRLGGKYTVKDQAGMTIHEQFHLFQKGKHPNWRPNDAYLLVYPLETTESLFLRTVEKEAFRRAVDSKNNDEAAGWAKEGLKYRKERLTPLGDQLSNYEMELQRFEGIAEYIETVSRGLDPQNLLAVTSGIAPSGVRDLGYVEGRLISFLLDRLDTTWKDKMESGQAQYPEELLAAAVANTQSSVRFSEADLEKFRAQAEADVAKWIDEKKQLVSDFYAAPGVTIEIAAGATPVGTLMFEPLAMENLGGGEILHKVFYMAGNDKGNLRVRSNPCISYMDSTYKITRVTITGLKGEPVIDAAAGTFKYDADGVSINFKGAKVTAADKKYRVEL